MKKAIAGMLALMTIIVGGCSSATPITNEMFIAQHCPVTIPSTEISKDGSIIFGYYSISRCEDYFSISPPAGSADNPGSKYELDGEQILMYCGGGFVRAGTKIDPKCSRFEGQECVIIAEYCMPK